MTRRKDWDAALIGGSAFTFGGLAIDAQVPVIGIHGAPIRGLSAMGDVAGIFFHDYRSCTRQTRKAVFARRAAKDAMASCNGGRA